MDHLKRVSDEFTRQAQTFAAWAETVDADPGGRFGAALGGAARGRLIDVACGPGVVTAALAPNARSVVAFDATEAMLAQTEARCAKAGLNNVEFRSGDAEALPFADAEFDGAVSRAAVHHFADPQRAFAEMFRVLRPGGIAVIADVISSENADESRLHNAIETAIWDMSRELEEWLAIVTDPARVEPVRIVVRALAEAGRSAGIGLSIRDSRVVFFHRWLLIKAVKPAGH